MTLTVTGAIWKKKPMYKYCTKKMVDKAVKQGREAAIKCASDKWWFFGTCTERQLKLALSRYGLGKNCSLCERFSSGTQCPDCPLSEKDGCRSNRSTYKEAVTLIYRWKPRPTATNFKKFQAKARKLARIIGRLK